MAVDALELLRCPKGCDPSFLQYLTWEGTQLRICADSKGEWVGTEGENYAEFVRPPEGSQDIGLRCGDCGTQFGRRAVPVEAKKALDNLLDRYQHTLSDFKDEIDDAWLRSQMG